MCGIIGFAGKQNAAPILLEGLKKLEYRGYDSAGIAVIDSSDISVIKGIGRVEELYKKTHNGKAVKGFIGIGHTRWATHGVPTVENSHPHLSNSGKFAIVHNGIIENYKSLKDELLQQGYKFESETDTEIIVNLIDRYYMACNGDVKKAFIDAVSQLDGSYAIGLICKEHPDKIYAVRKSSPLILGVGTDGNYFASDITALINHTNNAIYLEDNEFVELSCDNISVFDKSNKNIEKEISKIMYDVKVSEKGKYEHFMLKEIMEQPNAVKAAIRPRIREGKVFFDNEINLSSEQLRNINKIIITACGSAYYAGCSGKYALEQLCHIPVEVELASELRYRNPIIDEHTLVIGISQSGETADTIAAMKEAKSRKAKTLAIVNVEGSSLTKIADDTVYTWAGPEIAVATTKGYTTQVVVLYLLAIYFSDNLKLLKGNYTKYLNEILSLPEKIQQTIYNGKNIPDLAKKYYNSKRLFFIGRNTDYAVALEGALKLKEISYLHAEAYAAGELKHGTIALIEDQQPVIALCCNSQIMDKTVSNIMEVKSRGAKVLAVTTENNSQVLSIADDLMFVANTDPLFSAVTEIIPLQLFAYYVAKENGCDIDKPKNLAKSVTVE